MKAIEHMRRFFFNPADRDGDRVVLGGPEAHHISRVLRLGIGTEINLLDGTGAVYRARIEATGKLVQATILETLPQQELQQVQLSVGQGVLKGKKMDTVVQKCTELGVVEFLPFWSSRCQGKMNSQLEQKKKLRYERIVESACKQCERADRMEILQPLTYAESLRNYSGQPDILPVLFWEKEQENTLHTLKPSPSHKRVIVFFGPEGGWDDEEIELARSLGWQTVSLGPLILRAETATLTGVSIVQFLLGTI